MSSLTNAKHHGRLLGVALCYAHQCAKTLDQVPEAWRPFPETLCVAQWRQTPIPERCLGTPWGGKRPPTKRAHSDIIPNAPVATQKIQVTGQNQIGTEIRNYTLVKMKTFIEDLMQQKGERGMNWLLWDFLFVWNELLLSTAAKVHQLAGISKHLKLYNIPKVPVIRRVACKSKSLDSRSNGPSSGLEIKRGSFWSLLSRK